MQLTLFVNRVEDSVRIGWVEVGSNVVYLVQVVSLYSIGSQVQGVVLRQESKST